MAYNIGQLRRGEISNYSSNVSYESCISTTLGGTVRFSNPCLYLKGNNQVNSAYSYYLKFQVAQRPDSTQNFIITLYNGTATPNDTTLIIDNGTLDSDLAEEVRTFKVDPGTGTATFELIFTPNATYNQVIFNLIRESLDYSVYRQMDVTILAFQKLTNVVTNYLAKNFTGLTGLKKIGVQGPPGLLMEINGEEIQIGRSGIYELYNSNVVITDMGFVIKDSSDTQDGKDYFIMDFKY
jgi:hypothetical protein